MTDPTPKATKLEVKSDPLAQPPPPPPPNATYKQGTGLQPPPPPPLPTKSSEKSVINIGHSECSTLDEVRVDSLEEFKLHNINRDIAPTLDISKNVVQKHFRNAELLDKFQPPPDLAEWLERPESHPTKGAKKILDAKILERPAKDDAIPLTCKECGVVVEQASSFLRTQDDLWAGQGHCGVCFACSTFFKQFETEEAKAKALSSFKNSVKKGWSKATADYKAKAQCCSPQSGLPRGDARGLEGSDHHADTGHGQRL